MSRAFRLLSLASVLVATTSTVSFAQITVGTYQAGNCYPFICMKGDGYDRYQQVYTSSAFSSNVFINSLTFYRISQTGTFDGNTYTVSLSTTSQPVNGLSSDPNANLGANNTLFWTGVLSGNIGDSFTLTGTPFLYDPALGNLLMDVMVSGPFGIRNGTGNTYLQADYSGTVTSRAWGNDLSVNPDFVGLVTTFDVTNGPVIGPVPEPASLTLLGTGLMGLMGIGGRRFGRKSRANA